MRKTTHTVLVAISVGISILIVVTILMQFFLWLLGTKPNPTIALIVMLLAFANLGYRIVVGALEKRVS